MPAEITVGPPVLTINQGATFMVTNQEGEIAAETPQGVFSDDTRFVSYYAISANGYSWKRRTSSATNYYAVRVYLTNSILPTEDGLIPEGTLELVLSRAIGEGIHEDLDITNYGQVHVRFNLEVALRSDFADLFEVKAQHFVRRGRIVTEWREEDAELHTTYQHSDFERRFVYRVRDSDSRPHYANGRITFEIDLEPGAKWHACCHYVLVLGERIREPVNACLAKDVETHLDQLQRQWVEHVTQVTTSNEEVYRFYRQSVEDMGALRLHDQDLAPGGSRYCERKRTSSAGLGSHSGDFVQALGILDFDLLALNPDEPLRFEIIQRLRHRLAIGADHLSQVLMRMPFHYIVPSQLQQEPGELRRNALEGQAFEPPFGVGESPSHDFQEA